MTAGAVNDIENMKFIYNLYFTLLFIMLFCSNILYYRSKTENIVLKSYIIAQTVIVTMLRMTAYDKCKKSTHFSSLIPWTAASTSLGVLVRVGLKAASSGSDLT